MHEIGLCVVRITAFDAIPGLSLLKTNTPKAWSGADGEIAP
jgi:hypothetical protein